MRTFRPKLPETKKTTAAQRANRRQETIIFLNRKGYPEKMLGELTDKFLGQMMNRYRNTPGQTLQPIHRPNAAL